MRLEEMGGFSGEDRKGRGGGRNINRLRGGIRGGPVREVMAAGVNCLRGPEKRVEA